MKSQARWVALLSLGLASCGGNAESGAGGSAGAAGAGATGGSGAAAGSSGAAGSGAVAGSGGTGATAGSGASGGTAGTGGTTGPAPECISDSDCKLFSDCCTCVGLPNNHPDPASCFASCKVDMCTAHKVKAPICAAGRCVAGFDCDTSKVLCESLPPKCPPGQVVSVDGVCWGPCVEATQCRGVPSCADCTGPLTTCVKIDSQGGDATISSHCVSIPKGCEGTPTCDCMGSSVCISPYNACGDFSGIKGMGCSCPNC